MTGDEVSERTALVCIVAAIIYVNSVDATKAVRVAVRILDEAESQLGQPRKK